MAKPGTAIYGVTDGADPLLVVVPTFTTKAIGQSTPANGLSNTITVTLVTDIDLKAADSSVVTISGLSNAVATSPVTLLDAGDDGETLF